MTIEIKIALSNNVNDYLIISSKQFVLHSKMLTNYSINETVLHK